MWLSFRVAEKTTTKGSYGERYDALTKAVDGFTTAYWAETSSFYVFNSALDIDQIVQKVKAAIDVSCDKVVIGSNDTKTFRAIGDIQHLKTLQDLVGFAKKV
jgi:hypothetical protein